MIFDETLALDNGVKIPELALDTLEISNSKANQVVEIVIQASLSPH